MLKHADFKLITPHAETGIYKGPLRVEAGLTLDDAMEASKLGDRMAAEGFPIGPKDAVGLAEKHALDLCVVEYYSKDQKILLTRAPIFDDPSFKLDLVDQLTNDCPPDRVLIFGPGDKATMEQLQKWFNVNGFKNVTVRSERFLDIDTDTGDWVLHSKDIKSPFLMREVTELSPVPLITEKFGSLQDFWKFLKDRVPPFEIDSPDRDMEIEKETRRFWMSLEERGLPISSARTRLQGIEGSDTALPDKAIVKGIFSQLNREKNRAGHIVEIGGEKHVLLTAPLGLSDAIINYEFCPYGTSSPDIKTFSPLSIVPDKLNYCPLKKFKELFAPEVDVEKFLASL